MRYQYKSSLNARQRRHLRVRAKISGSTERPRLNVFRSSQHMYAQLIDDSAGHTICSASTLEKDFSARLGEDTTKTAKATLVGQVIGERALEMGISKVVYDRGGFRYHGRIKAVADAARAAGLDF